MLWIFFKEACNLEIYLRNSTCICGMRQELDGLAKYETTFCLYTMFSIDCNGARNQAFNFAFPMIVFV